MSEEIKQALRQHFSSEVADIEKLFTFEEDNEPGSVRVYNIATEVTAAAGSVHGTKTPPCYVCSRIVCSQDSDGVVSLDYQIPIRRKTGIEIFTMWESLGQLVHVDLDPHTLAYGLHDPSNGRLILLKFFKIGESLVKVNLLHISTGTVMETNYHLCMPDSHRRSK